MVCRLDLCLLPGVDVFVWLVVRGLAADCVAPHVRSVMGSRACKLNVLERAALALILSAPACAWAATGVGLGVPAAMTQVIAAQRLPPGAVSFVIVDPDSGRLVLSQNPDTPRSPASTIKVVTTFAALDLLGPAYTWHTRASIRGALDYRALDGDLILQGGADPYMPSARTRNSVPPFTATAQQTFHALLLPHNTTH